MKRLILMIGFAVALFTVNAQQRPTLSKDGKVSISIVEETEQFTTNFEVVSPLILSADQLNCFNRG
jgi:hypothetical protein